jgi:Domain of unknown function (DUF4262)
MKMGEQRFRRKVEQDIQRVGWTVVAVNGDPEINIPWWAYTVGVTRTHAHPELAIAGLPPELMQQILNTVGFLVRDGATFSDGTQADNVLQSYPVAFRQIHRYWFRPLFGSARRFYGNWSFAVLQVVYPDRDGRFPWDDGCSAAIRGQQPRLDLPIPPAGMTRSA